MKKIYIVLGFYYNYVEYIYAIVNSKKPKKLNWRHYFFIWLEYGYKHKAYVKFSDIVKRHFPELFIQSGWNELIFDKNYEPSIKSLAYSIKDKPKEKQDKFFKDLYAIA